jgi:hypothetical protein
MRVNRGKWFSVRLAYERIYIQEVSLVMGDATQCWSGGLGAGGRTHRMHFFHFKNKLQRSGYNVGFEVFTAVVMKSIFWDVTPYSLLSCNRRFGGTYRLHLHGRRNNFSNMEAICSSETSVATQQTTRHHIPEDGTLQVVILFRKNRKKIQTCLSHTVRWT